MAIPGGAGWSNKDDIALGFTFTAKKSGLELMQNCDLPPPLKVFSGLDKTVVSPPPTDKYGALEDHKEGSENEKLELLKALRLSQTRAREAERKYQVLSKEKDALSNLLLKESLRSLACRNSVRLLELQVSQLKKQQQYIHKGSGEESDNNTSSTWFMAMALCMGIAGVSLAFGYRCFFCCESFNLI